MCINVLINGENSFIALFVVITLLNTSWLVSPYEVVYESPPTTPQCIAWSSNLEAIKFDLITRDQILQVLRHNLSCLRDKHKWNFRLILKQKIWNSKKGIQYMFNSNLIGKVVSLKVQKTYPTGFMDPSQLGKKLMRCSWQACIALGFQNTYCIPI